MARAILAAAASAKQSQVTVKISVQKPAGGIRIDRPPISADRGPNVRVQTAQRCVAATGRRRRSPARAMYRVPPASRTIVVKSRRVVPPSPGKRMVPSLLIDFRCNWPQKIFFATPCQCAAHPDIRRWRAIWQSRRVRPRVRASSSFAGAKADGTDIRRHEHQI